MEWLQYSRILGYRSSMLARRIPWTEEPGGLQSMGSQRVQHDWSKLELGNKPNSFTTISGHSSSLEVPHRCACLSNPAFPIFLWIYFFRVLPNKVSTHVLGLLSMGCRYLTIGDVLVSVLNKNIELAKRFVGFSHKILWKNPNERFGQPNIFNRVKSWGKSWTVMQLPLKIYPVPQGVQSRGRLSQLT